MADPALSTDPLERYGAIERAYCEERWASVIHDGQTLLVDLARTEEGPPEGLKERLQLLIGHAFLYGLGDRDSAEDLYQAVLRSGAEASLRQIAEQGLQQCTLPAATAEAGDEPQEQEGWPDGGPSARSADGAASWQESTAAEPAAEVPLPPEPDSAPTLQVTPPATSGLQDSWQTSVPEAPSPESGALSWLTADASPPPQEQDRPASPVMPWLESAAAEPSGAAIASPLEPEDTLLHGGESAAALLSPLPEPQPEVLDVAAPPERADLQPPVIAASDELAGPEPIEASLPISPEGAAARRLVADVVEEPELIELYQAQALGGETLLAQPVEDPSPAPSLAEPVIETAVPEPVRLPPDGVDRRGADPLPSSPVLEPLEEQLVDPAPVAPAAAVVRPTLRVVSGSGPFNVPPEPVAEEDPELLMGLLTVEMG